jgi:peptidoglycan/xylan/chitin deacetylase (PgdA/CDA1 family)
VRKLIKQLFAAALYYSGLLTLSQLIRQGIFGKGRYILLTYHTFLFKDDPRRTFLEAGLTISPELFDHQIKFFKASYHLISLDELVDLFKEGKSIPRRTIVLTIDDGWRDNYTECFPVLTKHRAPATIFLTTDFVGTSKELWFATVGRILATNTLNPRDLAQALAPSLQLSAEKLESAITTESGLLIKSRLMGEFKKLSPASLQSVIGKLATTANLSADSIERGMMSWDEIREMAHTGVSFGSHGASHQIMTTLTLEQARAEYQSSYQRMTAELGTSPRHYAYPNGNHTDELALLARDSGYDSAAATGDGVRICRTEIDRFKIRRIGMHDATCTGFGGKFSRSLLALHLARFG